MIAREAFVQSRPHHPEQHGIRDQIRLFRRIPGALRRPEGADSPSDGWFRIDCAENAMTTVPLSVAEFAAMFGPLPPLLAEAFQRSR